MVAIDLPDKLTPGMACASHRQLHRSPQAGARGLFDEAIGSAKLSRSSGRSPASLAHLVFEKTGGFRSVFKRGHDRAIFWAEPGKAIDKAVGEVRGPTTRASVFEPGAGAGLAPRHGDSRRAGPVIASLPMTENRVIFPIDEQGVCPATFDSGRSSDQARSGRGLRY